MTEEQALLKRCSKCGEEKPATPEFFSRDKRRKDGLQSQCKHCVNTWQKAHRNSPEVHERKLAYMQTYRNRPESQERQKEWWKAYLSRPERREHLLAYQKAYHDRADVKERKKAYKEVYMSRPGVRERIRDYHASYYKGYSKRLETRERHRSLARVREQLPEGRSQRRAYYHNYQARKKSVQGTHTGSQFREVLKRHRFHCYWCGEKLRKNSRTSYGYEVHADHTFPLSRVVGTDIPANDISYIVPSCPTCNQSRCDRYPWEYPKAGRLL